MMAKTIEAKREIARGLDGERLLDLFIQYIRDFDPFDGDTIETFNVIREEVLRRLNR